MKHLKYDYAVVGGDIRQVYLTAELAGHQNRICHYALAAEPDKNKYPDASHVVAASSLENACAYSSCIICPIPLSKSGSHLNQNGLTEDLSLKSLLVALQPEQYFFAGCIPEDFRNSAIEKGVFAFDLMQNNTLAIYNTIATAEGAICEAISKSPINLNKSRCAVLGYGKCGRTLVSYLKGLFCHTYACSNNPEEQAQAAIISDSTGDLKDFKKSAGEFDFVFNTIPALVITADILAVMKDSVTIIDIASAPGGVDYQSAKNLGRTALLVPGLPGKYAPASSARALKESIETILSQEKCKTIKE
ncbi:dipicolinate synthase subunit DpsA [Faecalicatena contorta]|uniref:Dipicolinate synthase subunit A n=1 Tax=Faecalicatena contorta TaxID=39482 RepID=A0A315ZVQ5_9FIRM|nr:dipicolinate synthase subunit DpsA [Faecalicatena contorta]PWJ48948.1 dipicolinate synthase subunit A [Faecalicatena contorta]SUQ15038.1 dipicolinate synthase subunit A [Faecalicatena contorta]